MAQINEIYNFFENKFSELKLISVLMISAGEFRKSNPKVHDYMHDLDYLNKEIGKIRTAILNNPSQYGQYLTKFNNLQMEVEDCLMTSVKAYNSL